MLDSDGYCTMDPDASCWLARANVRMDIRMSASAKRMVDNGLVDENLHVIAMTIRSDQIRSAVINQTAITVSGL